VWLANVMGPRRCHEHGTAWKLAGIRVTRSAKPGYAHLHHAEDDDSRLVYS
jgi:hypothetical protein